MPIRENPRIFILYARSYGKQGRSPPTRMPFNEHGFSVWQNLAEIKPKEFSRSEDQSRVELEEMQRKDAGQPIAS